MANKKKSKTKPKDSEWLDEFKEAEHSENEDLKSKFDVTSAKPKADIDYSKKHDYREGQIVSCPNQSKNYNATPTATGTITNVLGDTVTVLDADGLLHWVKTHTLWVSD